MIVSDIEKLSLEGLQERYGELLTSVLKVEPDPLPSFLEISGFPHYEEVITNWYGFFFDTEAPHGFQTLFIDTLIEIITKPAPKQLCLRLKNAVLFGNGS